MKITHIVAAAFAFAISAPAAAQVDLPNPAGPWVHAPSGVSFPELNGDLQRKTIQSFDQDARDVGVSYHLFQGGKLVGFSTVYVYPAPPGDCDAAWDFEKKHTIESGNEILSESSATSLSGATSGAAHHAMVERHIGSPGNPVPSATYFYCVPGGQWLVKYYASWKGTASLEGPTINLLHAISWPAAFRR